MTFGRTPLEKPQAKAAARFAYFRTSLMPLERLASFADSIAKARQGDLSGVASLLGDRLVASALSSANPSFIRRLEAELASGKLGDKNANSLLRYLARMSSRCTPFGLLAGVFPTEIRPGHETCVELDAADTWTVFPRLSYERVYELVRGAFREQVDRDGNVPVQVNPNMERRGDRLKVTAYQPLQGKITPAVYDVVIDASLEAVLDACGQDQTVASLAGMLQSRHPEVSEEEARAYVLDLLDCGVLADHYFPSLDPAVPVSDSVVSRCGNNSDLALIARSMGEVARPLSLKDCSPARLQRLASLALPASPASAADSQPGRVDEQPDVLALQLDLLVRPRTNRLGSDFVARIEDVAGLLAAAAAAVDDPLKALKEEFRRKFGEETVPLLQAMSADDGLSINPLVGNRPSYLAALPLSQGREKTQPRWSAIDRMMIEKLACAGSDANEIVIDPAEVRKCATSIDSDRAAAPAWTLGLLYERCAGSDGTKPPHLYLPKSFGFGGAGSIAGRFAHMDHGILEAFVASSDIESTADAIVADVLYLPEPRIGNVSCRPPGYRYQIPIFGFATDPACETIAPSELSLTLDRHDRFVLNSTRLGRQVVPRIASAHNYLHPECAPIYRFLGMLQEQDAPALRTDLLWFARKNPSVPSVRVGHVLLTPRSWFVDAETLKKVKSSRSPVETLCAKLMAMRCGRLVRFGNGDRFVTCDTRLEPFLHLMLEEDELLLHEAVPEGYEPAARSDDGDRQLEVAILHPTRPAVNRQTSFAVASPHLPGASDWVYAKLYGGNLAIESWLAPLAVLAEENLRRGDITAWHFVRYMDPDRHLRIRFRSVAGEGGGLARKMLSAIGNCLQPGRACFDTYFPEVSRYGGHAVIDAVHAIFSIDSMHVAKAVQSPALATAEQRVRYSVLSSNALAEGLGLGPAEIGPFWARLADGYVARFAGDDRSALRKKLGSLWRSWRKEILDASFEFSADLARYRSQIEAAAAPLREQASLGNTTCPLTEIAVSVVHMHMNRLFVDSPNENEMTSYSMSYHYTRSNTHQRATADPDGEANSATSI